MGWCCKQEWFCLSLKTLHQLCNTEILLGVHWVLGVTGCLMLLGGMAGSFHVTWFAAVLGMTNQVFQQKDCLPGHPPKEVKTEDVQAGVCFGCSVAPLFNMLGLGLLFLFFLIFLMCIFRSAFKQGTKVPNLRNQGKQEGACCANILGNDRASHRNFNSDRRGERGKRRFRLFLSQFCTWLTWKSPSPKDY